eukprot:5672781-Pyramimonas_sp.AAC.1
MENNTSSNVLPKLLRNRQEVNPRRGSAHPKEGRAKRHEGIYRAHVCVSTSSCRSALPATPSGSLS